MEENENLEEDGLVGNEEYIVDESGDFLKNEEEEVLLEEKKSKPLG